MISLVSLTEAPPNGIVGHTVLNTRFVSVGRVIPLFFAHLQLHQLHILGSIIGKVIAPDKRVVNFAVVGFERQVTVIECESRVDHYHIIRYTREVVFSGHMVEVRCINRCAGIGVEQRVDNERRTATMVHTHSGRTQVQICRSLAVIHEDTIGQGQFRQGGLKSVNQSRVGMQSQIKVRRIDISLTAAHIAPLPAVIDSRSTLLAHQTAFRIILSRVRVGERDSVEHNRDNHTVTGYIIALIVRLNHLAGHILDYEQLVELCLVSNTRHLDKCPVGYGVTRSILDLETVSAEEVQTPYAVVKVRKRAVRHHRGQ